MRPPRPALVGTALEPDPALVEGALVPLLDLTPVALTARRTRGHGMMDAMSDIERRRPSRPTRKQREARAYRLVLATGALGLVGIAGIVLAIFTSFGMGWPLLALVLAAICFMLLRRTLR